MGHLAAKQVKSWPGLRASLCADGRWLYLKPLAPMPLSVAIGVGVLLASGGLGLHLLLGSGYAVVTAGMAMGGLVGICGHQLWRLAAPAVAINRQRGEMVFGKGQSPFPLHRVDHLKLSIYADQWRGYREMELSVVLRPDGTEQKGYVLDRAKMELAPDDSDRRIVIFNRNNVDGNPFRFHGESAATEMEDLARTLAEESDLPIQIERKKQGDVLVDAFPD